MEVLVVLVIAAIVAGLLLSFGLEDNNDDTPKNFT